MTTTLRIATQQARPLRTDVSRGPDIIHALVCNAMIPLIPIITLHCNFYDQNGSAVLTVEDRDKSL